MKANTRRGRFAPTPSSLLHIGNAWTALLAWLQMRQCGGTFVLRIEDIDRPRSRPDLVPLILDDLRWLGLDWDEGPDSGGPYAPYTQSSRQPLYEAALQLLQRDGWLYPCYCSRADLLAIASAPHGLRAEGPAYPGTCRNLSAAERTRLAAKKEPSLRFALPDCPIAFDDGCAGPQYFPPGAGGDFVVKRADGIIAYQLAVVVDDAAMNITDVVRGRDLLDSTPRQILLYEALGLTPPCFAHVPLVCGPDGNRLSKRHGAISISDIRTAGTKPEQVIGWMAYWCGVTDRPKPMKAQELMHDVKLDKLPQGPIVLDEKTLQSFVQT